ncbi:MAG: ABC transporter permease [Planctomycetes bacterium]|nr:ABC transporter permease [Planctomycetota bacterium]
MILKELKAEIYKLYRSQLFLVGYVGLIAFALLWVLMFEELRFTIGKRSADLIGEDFASLQNGVLFSMFTFFSAFYLLFPIFTANIAGRQISGEAKDGTLRFVLVRPTSRVKIFFAKAITSWLYVALLMFFYQILTLALGTSLFGYGPLFVYPNFTDIPMTEPFVLELGAATVRILLAGQLAVVGLMVVGSFSILLSVMFDHPLVAVIGSITGYLISYIFQINPMFEDWHPYLLTDPMDFWVPVFALEPGYSDMSNGLWKSIAYIVVFQGLALYAFVRKDVTS